MQLAGDCLDGLVRHISVAWNFHIVTAPPPTNTAPNAATSISACGSGGTFGITDVTTTATSA